MVSFKSMRRRQTGRLFLWAYLLAIFFLILLPWLNPFAPGPIPTAVPLLVSMACTSLLLGLGSLWPERLGFDRWVLAVALAWLVAGLLSTVIGLLQYFGVAWLFSPWMNQPEVPMAGRFAAWLTQPDVGSAYANLRQRNQFASLTSIALAALLWLVARGRVDGCNKWLMGLAASLLGVGNAASSSRTGMLQLALLVVLWGGLWGGWRQPALRRLLLLTLAAYTVSLLALPWLAGLDASMHGAFARLRTGDSLCTSRLTLWSNMLQLIGQKPWFGWGWGELDYAHYITLYDGARFCGMVDNAHNLPLHLAVELGVPAVLLICGAVVGSILSQRPWRETDLTRQLAWAVLAMIGLHSLLEYPLWYGPFQMAAGLCVLLLWQGSSRRVAVENKSKRLLTNPVQGLLAIVLIASVIFAYRDYHRISQIYLAPVERDADMRDITLIKIRGSWLFGKQMQFSELVLTPVTADNAQLIYDRANHLLHFSPEPQIIQKLIESAVMLGKNEEALAHEARYGAAFVQEHALWNKEKGPTKYLSVNN